jgi:hypothetical protein
VRVGVAAGGFAAVLVGAALLVLPGPGIPLLVVGFGLLALEFRWAEAALLRALGHAERAQKVARASSGKQRVASAGAVLALAGGVALALVVWGIPELPF